MNARAAELGMRGATFRNPEGLDEPGHLMSAADLALLARAALRQPVIAQIVATPATTVRSSKRAYALRSTNLLLGSFPGAIGVKTGTTDAAGECLVALVERDGRRLLSVLLGSGDRYAETVGLIEWGFANHRWVELPPALAESAAPRGWVASLAPGPPVAVPATQVQFIDYRLRLTPPGHAPGGTVAMLLFERTLAERPIALAPSAARPGRGPDGDAWRKSDCTSIWLAPASPRGGRAKTSSAPAASRSTGRSSPRWASASIPRPRP